MLGWHDVVFGAFSAMTYPLLMNKSCQIPQLLPKQALDCVMQRVHYLIFAFFILFDMPPPILRILRLPTNRFKAFIGRTYTNPKGLS